MLIKKRFWEWYIALVLYTWLIIRCHKQNTKGATPPSHLRTDSSSKTCSVQNIRQSERSRNRAVLSITSCVNPQILVATDESSYISANKTWSNQWLCWLKNVVTRHLLQNASHWGLTLCHWVCISKEHDAFIQDWGVWEECQIPTDRRAK
jgi:hypothetical protein